MKDDKKHKRIGRYTILIGVAAVLLILFVILPLIIVGPKRIPDSDEIRNRFTEFLVQPEDIEGIEARISDGFALFKYHTTENDIIDQLEKQAVAKGWITTKKNNSTIELTRENHLTKNGKIVLFQYDLAKASRSDKPDLICIGYDHIISTNRISDIKNNTDGKVIENTSWRKLNSCAAGTL